MHQTVANDVPHHALHSSKTYACLQTISRGMQRRIVSRLFVLAKSSSNRVKQYSYGMCVCGVRDRWPCSRRTAEAWSVRMMPTRRRAFGPTRMQRPTSPHAVHFKQNRSFSMQLGSYAKIKEKGNPAVTAQHCHGFGTFMRAFLSSMLFFYPESAHLNSETLFSKCP